MKERRTLGNIVRAVGVAEAAELWRTVASVISCPTRVISDQITSYFLQAHFLLLSSKVVSSLDYRDS